MPVYRVFRSSYINLQLNYFNEEAFKKINFLYEDDVKDVCNDITRTVKMNVFYI